MSSVPDGRAANQPLSRLTFKPPMGAPLPGAWVSTAWIVSPASSVIRTCCRESLASSRLLRRGRRRLDAVVDRLAEIAGELAIELAGIAPIRAVISAASSAGTMPSLSVVQTLPSQTQERRARALLAAEAERAVEQAVHEPLEADRHFVERPAELRGDAIDHLAADHRLADRRAVAPLRPVLEEVVDGDREVVIGRQKPRAAGDDSVPVVVGVAGEGDIEAILQADQSLHRVGRGGIHADLAVPIDRHESESRIDRVVDDREVQPVALGDRPPVVDPGAAERIDTEAIPAPRIASMSITLPRSATYASR